MWDEIRRLAREKTKPGISWHLMAISLAVQVVLVQYNVVIYGMLLIRLNSAHLDSGNLVKLSSCE